MKAAGSKWLYGETAEEIGVLVGGGTQAVVKAFMLLDSHAGYESLVVVPDYPRYRDLAHRTRTGRAAAGIHVVLVREDGSVTCETWMA